jgi:putative endonuclease
MNPAPQERGWMNPALSKWFYVYLLRGRRDNSLYIGCTSNLRKRLTFHKKGKVYSTRRMLPMELIYFEAYKSKQDAFEREKKLKHHGSALRNLKLRLKNIFWEGGAG